MKIFVRGENEQAKYLVNRGVMGSPDLSGLRVRISWCMGRDACLYASVFCGGYDGKTPMGYIAPLDMDV
jgi:hypothetical protein